MKSKTIDRIIVSNTNPHNNNTLWVDTSNGERNAVLKYKGKTIVGGNTNNNTVQQGKNTIDSNLGVLSMYIPNAGEYTKSQFETLSGITSQDLIDASNGLYRWVRKLPNQVAVELQHGGIGLVTEPTLGSFPSELPIMSFPNLSAATYTIGVIDFNGIWLVTYNSNESYTVAFTSFGS